MKRLTPILLTIAVLLLGGCALSPRDRSGTASKKQERTGREPPCPGSYDITWTDCVGTHIYVDGSKYTGNWKNGAEHGRGVHTWNNGDKYVGEYKDGKYDGQGTLTFANGD